MSYFPSLVVCVLISSSMDVFVLCKKERLDQCKLTASWLLLHGFSIAGSLGAPVLNGSAPNQRATSLPLNGQTAVAAPVLPTNFTPPVLQSVGSPSECLLLKNMFDPSTEVPNTCIFCFHLSNWIIY